MKFYRLLSLLGPLCSAAQRPTMPLDDVTDVVLDELEGSRLPRAAVLALLGCLEARTLASKPRVVEGRGVQGPDVKGRDIEGSGVHTDRAWTAAFRDLQDVADQLRSRFLSAWVDFELSLRDGLARVRARQLGWDAPQRVGYAVDCETLHAELLKRAFDESDSFMRAQIVDEARLRELQSLPTGAPFSLDEVLQHVAARVVRDGCDVSHRNESNAKPLMALVDALVASPKGRLP